jgi:formylglycine-generating enzyme
MHKGFAAALVTFVVMIGGAYARSGRATSPSAGLVPLGSRGACAEYDGVPEGFAVNPRAGMVRVRGGTLTLGSKHGYREELPAGTVRVADFYIDRTEVTNAQFARFVAATGYVTQAERTGSAPVFDRNAQPDVEYGWWRTAQAHRLAPDGDARLPAANEPVVQIALEDAFAYASWLGHDLPSEAEWEWAARAGRSDAGLDKAPRDAEGTPLANYWQGAFPAHDEARDGFRSRAPVGCFAANALGLHDTIGNVWEWTKEPWFASHAEAQGACQAQRSGAEAFVIKGGSYLCSSDFCARYRVSARHRQDAAMSAPHIGFRTVLRASDEQP